MSNDETKMTDKEFKNYLEDRTKICVTVGKATSIINKHRTRSEIKRLKKGMTNTPVK